MPRMSPFRIKAAIIHLIVSAVLIGAVCLVALLQWFPYPIFLIDGTWVALLTLALVDLLLGPFITLVISSNKKSAKELLFDYAVVLCIQLAALSFGLVKIYDQRVVALVHVENQFHLVAKLATPNEYDAMNLPAFKGIKYGMLLQQGFSGLSVPEIESRMYNPGAYHLLDSTEVLRSLASTEFVPDPALQKYGDAATYKFIVGKKRHGVAVLNNKMEIVDIYLEKRDSDS